MNPRTEIIHALIAAALATIAAPYLVAAFDAYLVWRGWR